MRHVMQAFFMGGGIWITMFGVTTVLMMLFLSVAVRLNISSDDGFTLWIGAAAAAASISVILFLPRLATKNHDRRVLMPWLVAAGLECAVSVINTVLDLLVDYHGHPSLQQTIWQLDALHILPLGCLLLGYAWVLWTEPARLRTKTTKKTPAE